MEQQTNAGAGTGPDTGPDADNQVVIDRYFAAMRRGPAAEDDLVALFTDGAIYDEPFSGLDPAIGRDAVRQRLRRGWETPLPDLELDVLAVEVRGSTASARWECRSPGLPGPVQGEDRYEFTDGRINRLEVRFVDDDRS